MSTTNDKGKDFGCLNFIDGEWRGGCSEILNVNPSDLSDVIGPVAMADKSMVDEAVNAASHGVDVWASSTPQQRFDVLDKIGSEILARREELGALLSREEGKTLPEGIGEVTRAGYIFKYYAGEALRIEGGRLASLRPGVEVDIRREPEGIIALITPWNFPIAIPAWKTAPALAYGNAVILKPSEITPACATALAEIIARSGLPKGVFNLLHGHGEDVGAALVAHSGINAVSFTGSQRVGRAIAAVCAGDRKKVQLEMGGKNPLVVLDDADIDQAVSCAIDGAFFATGQRCTASSRLIVTEGVYAQFVSAMVAAMGKLRIGHALEPQSQIGPLASQMQMDKFNNYLKLAKEEGAHFAYGGDVPDVAYKGFYVTPVLLTGLDNESRINREEVFGPLASVIKVPDYEAALQTANDTLFGLCAGICTTSLARAADFKNRAQAGMVMVNLPTAGVDYHVPFGGSKESSFGSREQGRSAVEFYTKIKTAYTAA